MELGLSEHIDLALVLLYIFWGFFAFLIFYLNQEGKREGFPLVNDMTDGASKVAPGGIFDPPKPKTFRIADGSTVSVPDIARADTRELAAVPTSKAPGSPIEPTGNPMLDGLGAAAWAERQDICDVDAHGKPKIVPMRTRPEMGVYSGNVNPIGLPVVGADGEQAGTVSDLWIDPGETLIRYFEVDVTGTGKRLMPFTGAFVNSRKKQVECDALLAAHFAQVPGMKSDEQVTRLEEEKIMAYYGGGLLYATPERLEPIV